MALFKPFRGSRTTLNTQVKHDGYAYFCIDDGSFHIDYVDSEGNLQRKQINDAMIVRFEALEKIVNNSPLVDSFDGSGVLDAGTIIDTTILDINIIDPGRIIEY
jgi:hypothetical protein